MLYPKYIVTCDGYIGTFSRLEYGMPVYRFPGGERIADGHEVEQGSDSRVFLEKKAEEIQQSKMQRAQ